jgi:hypothetical protein
MSRPGPSNTLAAADRNAGPKCELISGPTPAEPGTIMIVKTASLPRLSGLARKGEALLYLKGNTMWMGELKHGEHVGELPAYAPAFKERFIVEALGGDEVAATGLFQR